jgi:hypothetical protein
MRPGKPTSPRSQPEGLDRLAKLQNLEEVAFHLGHAAKIYTVPKGNIEFLTGSSDEAAVVPGMCEGF